MCALTRKTHSHSHIFPGKCNQYMMMNRGLNLRAQAVPSFPSTCHGSHFVQRSCIIRHCGVHRCTWRVQFNLFPQTLWSAENEFFPVLRSLDLWPGPSSYSRGFGWGKVTDRERETNNDQICCGCQVREMRNLGDMIAKVLSSSDYIMTQNRLHHLLACASL